MPTKCASTGTNDTLCQRIRFFVFFPSRFFVLTLPHIARKRIKLFFCHVRLMAVLCNNLMASVCRCTRVCWISEQSPQIIRCPQIRFSFILFSLDSFFVPHRWFDILFVQPFCNIAHLLSRCISGKSFAQIRRNLFILYHVAFTIPADITKRNRIGQSESCALLFPPCKHDFRVHLAAFFLKIVLNLFSTGSSGVQSFFQHDQVNTCLIKSFLDCLTRRREVRPTVVHRCYNDAVKFLLHSIINHFVKCCTCVFSILAIRIPFL